MGDVVKFRIPKLAEKHRGNTLCKRGFHKWETDNSSHFDTKQGKLVTRERCRRCGATRTRAT